MRLLKVCAAREKFFVMERSTWHISWYATAGQSFYCWNLCFLRFAFSAPVLSSLACIPVSHWENIEVGMWWYGGKCGFEMRAQVLPPDKFNLKAFRPCTFNCYFDTHTSGFYDFHTPQLAGTDANPLSDCQVILAMGMASTNGAQIAL